MSIFLVSEDGTIVEEDLKKIERLPSEHKGKIFTALEKHFSKYNDLIKNTSNIPQREDL